MDLIEFVNKRAFPEKLAAVLNTFGFTDPELEELEIEEINSTYYKIGEIEYIILDDHDIDEIIKTVEESYKLSIHEILKNEGYEHMYNYINWNDYFIRNPIDINEFIPGLTELYFNDKWYYYSDLI